LWFNNGRGIYYLAEDSRSASREGLLSKELVIVLNIQNTLNKMRINDKASICRHVPCSAAAISEQEERIVSLPELVFPLLIATLSVAQVL
jgi:hypothetical protein